MFGIPYLTSQRNKHAIAVCSTSIVCAHVCQHHLRFGIKTSSRLYTTPIGGQGAAADDANGHGGSPVAPQGQRELRRARMSSVYAKRREKEDARFE